jgi:hypothetical protein
MVTLAQHDSGSLLDGTFSAAHTIYWVLCLVSPHGKQKKEKKKKSIEVTMKVNQPDKHKIN